MLSDSILQKLPKKVTAALRLQTLQDFMESTTNKDLLRELIEYISQIKDAQSNQRAYALV